MTSKKYSYNNLPIETQEFAVYLWEKSKETLNENRKEELLIMYQELPYYHHHLENRLPLLTRFYRKVNEKELEEKELKEALRDRLNNLEKMLELKLKANAFVEVLL